MASLRPSKRLAIFCDGTWVGRETNISAAPPSNIRMLTNMVGVVQYKDNPGDKPTLIHPLQTDNPNITAGYQEGVGLNKTFLEYLWDGATASTIGEECIAVYKFIVDNFTDDHEISMFGFSRGAFTVRCVAGMINNCGIIKRHGLPSDIGDEDIYLLCKEVWRTYRSPLAIDHPKSDRCRRIRLDDALVWQVDRPIRFLGLIDTVGALGIPRLTAGIGFSWPEFEFHNQNVSSAVQTVYHATAMHERLWIFQPCLMFAGKEQREGGDGNGNERQALKPEIHQRWFPGTHYDVGRMTFRFIRQAPSNIFEKALGFLPDALSRTIYGNQVLADAVLKWILEGVRDMEDGAVNPVIDGIEGRINQVDKRLADPIEGTTGSGDIYGNVLDYAPAGRVLGFVQRINKSITSFLNNIFPELGNDIQDLIGIRTIVGILTATMDRRVPGYGDKRVEGEVMTKNISDGAREDQASNVYNYKEEEIVWIEGVKKRFSVENTARMQVLNEWGNVRYPSRTFENWVLWGRVFGGR